MNLVFKNPTIKTDYELNQKRLTLSKEEASRFWTKHEFGEERIAFSILVGYLSSLCEIAEECEQRYGSYTTLDLTYDTVEHFPVILGQMYFNYIQSGSYTSEKAIEIANKTLASYFMLLCMNEHMCFPSVSRLSDFDKIMKNVIGNGARTQQDSWMGFTVKVGVNKEYDLLEELNSAVKVSASGVFRIRISRLVELYKQMCGVDLREKGLDDFEGELKKQV